MTSRREIDRALWQRLSALLDEGLVLEGEARTRWLEDLNRREPQVAARLAEMLGAAGTAVRTLPADGPTTVTAVGVAPTADEARAMGTFDRHLARALIGADLAGTRLGAWQLEAKIGEGGMGQVWRARRADGLYEAQAAIKLLRGDLAAGGLAGRFARERSLLARLSHPAIARLLDAGVAGGQAYLVLELVPGRTLSVHVRALVPTVAGRVKLLLRIAEAVDHAHAQLIVHRDLKPSNVIVTETGDAKLLDFGIAALVDPEQNTAGDSDLTRQTGRGLTVGYAAPEQVTGAAVTTTTDVFSLGVMLYELLSGELPFGRRRLGRAAAEHALLHDQPVSFREAARRGRGKVADPEATMTGESSGPGRPIDIERTFGDLEAVTAKALRKDPQLRYGSVRELMEDLQRWLDRRPVSARSEHWRHNTRLWFQRHALLAGAIGALVLTLVGGLVVSTWQWRRAEAARLQSEAVTRYMTEMLAEASPDRHGGVWPTVLQLLDRSREQIDTRFADAPEAKLEMLRTLIVTYRTLNRFDLSMPLAEKWVALATQRYGEQHARTIEAKIEQARGYQIQGLFDRAMQIGEPLLEPARRVLGEDADEVRNLIYLLTACYTRTGRLDDAERMLAEGGRLIAKGFPAEHPIHGSHLNHVQVLRAAQGRLREALQAMQRTQRWWAQPPADYQREVLVWRRNTLAIQIRLAEYAGLEERARTLLDDMDRVLGAGNDMALGLRNELARYFTDTGQVAQAFAEREATMRYAERGGVQHVALLAPMRAQTLLAAAQAQRLEPAKLRSEGRALLDAAVTQAQAIGFPRSEIFLSVARAALALDDAELAADALQRMAADGGLKLDTDKLLASRKWQLDGQLARLRGDHAASKALLLMRRERFDKAVERRIVPGWNAAIDLAFTLVVAGDAGAAAGLDDALARRPENTPPGHPLDAASDYLRARLTQGEASAAARAALAELARRQGGEPKLGLGSLRGAI